MSQSLTGFLQRIHPFSGLPRQLLGEAAGAAEVRHLPGREVLEAGADGAVGIVRSGSLELLRGETVLDLLAVGDCVGFEVHLAGAPPGGSPADDPAGVWRVRAVEDSALLLLPGAVFRKLLAEPACSAHFSRRKARLDLALEAANRAAGVESDPFLRLAVGAIPLPPPVFVDPDTPLAEVAARMAEARVTACLVGDGERAQGILTERDVLDAAARGGGAELARPVSALMSRDLVTVRGEGLLFEAFSTMISRGIRRLVVVDAEGRALGIVGERDLLSARGENPLSLVREAREAGSLEALGEANRRLQNMALRTLAEGLAVENVGRVISEIHDALLVRAAQLVSERLGEPPAPYALMVLGSEGRREQYLATDQDNALILSDGLSATGLDFFADFASRLVRALVDIGLPACPSRIMMDNPDWRLPLGGWTADVDDRVLAADAPAVLRLSLLADARHVLGEAPFTTRLRGHLARRVRQAPIIPKYMAREALRFTPPLGFFHNLVLEKSGAARGGLDIKRGAIFPVTQGARTLALDLGLAATATPERLAGARDAGILSGDFTASLVEAFGFLQTLRVRVQAEAVRRGAAPDNVVRPERLSGLERDRLKDCLKMVVEFQSVLHSRYGLRLMS